MAFRKLAGLSLAFGLAGSLVFGCAKQGEGERCDLDAAGNDDCDTGLVCVDSALLADKSTDRCCPPEDRRYSDSRCARGGTLGGSTGSGGSSAGKGGSGGSSASEGGAPGDGGAGG